MSGLRSYLIPSWCGHYDLVPNPDQPETRTRLLVTDATAGERAVLATLFEQAKREKWIGENAAVPAGNGRYELDFDAPLSLVGVSLATSIVPSRSRLTAIKSRDGTVEVVYNDADVHATPAEKAEAADVEKKGILEKVKDKAAEVAATVKAPTRCCPKAMNGPEERANRVLDTFLDEEQRRLWLRYGYFFAYGHRTGHRYRVAHRNSDIAVRQSKVLWDMTDDHVVHAYDHSVPPGEECLAMKLYIEHHEECIRNEATLALMDDWEVFSERRLRLDDPTHPGITAGTADAGFFTGLAYVLPLIAKRQTLPGDPLQAVFRSDDGWDD